MVEKKRQEKVGPIEPLAAPAGTTKKTRKNGMSLNSM